MFVDFKNLRALTELKQRLWFVLWGLIVFRIGVHIPVPGIDASRLAEIFAKNQHNILVMDNLF
jgi:preprotein translocase subunit SecY